MKDKKEIAAADYETAKKQLMARMELEKEEKINLKIKIATFVIYELSHSTPDWFKSYFLSNIAQNTNQNYVNKNEDILKVESAFYNIVADYLLTMEVEVDYVRNILAPFTEAQKKDFWKPVVFDAFLLAEIYFTEEAQFGNDDQQIIRIEQLRKMINPRCLCQMLS
jgi:hypothetical protein